jgi:hypothetical protein
MPKKIILAGLVWLVSFGSMGCDDDDPGGSPAALVLDQPCDYEGDRGRASCLEGTLTYCGTDNLVGAIACQDQCLEWHGETYGSGLTSGCGPSPVDGLTGCLCYPPEPCEASCYDATTFMSCPDGGSVVRVDCVESCQEQGHDNGSCSPDGCLCS